jgi:hypothetical protein
LTFLRFLAGFSEARVGVAEPGHLKGFARRSTELFEGVPTRDNLDEGVASPLCVDGRGRYLDLGKNMPSSDAYR